MMNHEGLYYMRENGSPNKTRVKVLGVDFKVSADKKKVVAIMRWQPVVDFTSEWFDPQVSRGVASLRPGDEFDERKGQRIALARAESAAYDELTKIVRSHNTRSWHCSSLTRWTGSLISPRRCVVETAHSLREWMQARFNRFF